MIAEGLLHGTFVLNSIMTLLIIAIDNYQISSYYTYMHMYMFHTEYTGCTVFFIFVCVCKVWGKFYTLPQFYSVSFHFNIRP